MGHLLPWSISFLLNKKKKIFSPYAYCFIYKNNRLNSNFVEKKIISYCFPYKVTFSMSKVNIRFFSFIETKSLNIDLFTNESQYKFKFHGGEVSPEKRKKVSC